MSNETETATKEAETMTVTVPIREKTEYRLDNGIMIEKWTKVSKKDFEVDSSLVTEEQAEKIKNGAEVMWWGVAKLPRQTPFGVEEVPFHFAIGGATLEEVAGNYESRLEEALADLEKKLKKQQEQQQNQIIPASAADLSALQNGAAPHGGIIS